MQSEFRPRKVNTALDICSYNLVKCIKCDVPCSEGYGPANLVATNFIERSKGFLAERFIKPPVNLTLEFKMEINIEYVAIICSVGAQKSKGLELFSLDMSKGSCYESIASGVLPDDKIGFVFHRFNVNVKDMFGDNFCFRKFKSSRFLYLVNNIKLKIFCTSGASIPALGKIEIWGTPVKSVSLRHDGRTRPRPTLKPQTISPKGTEELDLTTMSCKSSEPEIIKPSNLSLVIRKAELDQSFTIPEDFIDPISCEFMIQPIILPSGKIIDSSTLKSHEKAELRWGRGPSDPFTGIPFSASNKPIAAADLKSRIDKFLSDNCHVSELQNMPRTLGTKGTQNQRCDVVVSELVTKTRPSEQSLVKNLPTDRCSSSTFPYKLKPVTTLKRKNFQIDSVASCSFECVDDSRNNLLSTSETSKVNHTEVGIFKKLKCATKAHDTFQERMEQSLELALKSTLSKLPNFTSDKIDSVEKACTAFCNTCKSLENLFSIPCKHFVCRICLLQVKRDKIPTICLLCSCEYKTSDVQKVHTR